MLSYITGLVQDCNNSSALAMELLQSCTEPSISSWGLVYHICWCPGSPGDINEKQFLALKIIKWLFHSGGKTVMLIKNEMATSSYS